MKILEINNLVKSYDGKKNILDNISTSFEAGEFVVIIGASGAGKSTLIRCINQMVTPTSGTIMFDNCNINNANSKKIREIRSNIGMIFQHYNLVNRTNVIKNVLHGRLGQMSFLKSSLGLYTNEDKNKAYELLDKVGLKEQIYKKAGSLSGGQMQRVGICRAIIQNPKLLLADEPIASLDPLSSTMVMDTIKKITTELNLTCIVNLHQVEYAKKYATRIIGIKDGKIVFDGKAQQLSEEIVNNIYERKEEQIYIEEEFSSEISYA